MVKKLSKYLVEYLDSRVIFTIDFTLSVLTSLVVLLLMNFFSSGSWYTGHFAAFWMIGSVVFSIVAILISRNYKAIIRRTTLRDLKDFVSGVFIKVLLLGVFIAVFSVFSRTVLLGLVIDFLITLFLVVCVRLFMIVVYDAYKSKVNETRERCRLLVYGTSDKSAAVISRFQESSHYQILGFISNNPEDQNHRLSEYPIFYCPDKDEFQHIAEEFAVGAVLFTRDMDVKEQEKAIVSYCSQHSIKTLITPSVDEVVDGKIMKGARQIRVEDLLGRPEIKISLDEIRSKLAGKVVMVTGAAGSIGSELCRQLARFGIKQLVLYDNAETPMHTLRLELEARFPDLDFVPVMGSVRHIERLDFAFRNWKPQVVFHAAAYKHVPLMEENPCEAVLSNVVGSRNVADKCVAYGVEMMVMISTDKAVNPTNIMGCSKRLAEIYVQSLGLALANGEVAGNTKFVTTRFGNVLGSNGSVIPRFREQIEHGGPVTVTHPDINRFFMTIPEACRLVMEAATLGHANRIFVFDMGQSVKIVDLARRMIELAGFIPDKDIMIEFTGLRPGEKLYEEVLATSENTEPTSHERIRIARVREYQYSEACSFVDELYLLASQVRIPEMVRRMKEIVPEYKSVNSKFEIYDKERT